jgi:DNA-binding IclR family transcriptional regulator
LNWHFKNGHPETQSVPSSSEIFPFESMSTLPSLPELLESAVKSRLERNTTNSITDPKRLRAEIEMVRKQCWAAAPGETMSGLNAYAVPIFDGSGQLFGTLALLGLDEQMPIRPTRRHIAELSSAARQISAALYGPPFPKN